GWWPYAALIGGGSLLFLLLIGTAVWLVSLAGRESPEKALASHTNSPGTGPTSYTNGLGMEFVRGPKGESWLGGGGGEAGKERVVIKEDFYLGKYEVTQEEWEKVTGNNPSHFKADPKRFPVDNVSWEDCQSFVKLLNARAGEADWVYRLPRRKEWEYA